MAFTVPVSTSVEDPYGSEILRSLEDTRRAKKCPFAELEKGANGDKEVQTLLDDCWKFLGTKVKEADEGVRDETASPSWFAQFRAAASNKLKDISYLTRRHTVSATKTPEEEELVNKNQKEDPKITKNKVRLQALVDVFDKLSGNRWIKRAHSYKRLHKDHLECKTPKFVKAWYIVFPMIVFFFSFGFQSFMLHITTHLYIVYIKEEKGDKERQREGGQLLDIVGNLVAKYLSGNDSTLGEGAVFKGHVNIPMWLLDASAAIPLLFCVLAYGLALFWMNSFNIGLWNKTYIVASLMAITKGLFDVVTILPDSIGWQNCEDRLSKSGVESLANLDFGKKFWQSLFYQMWTEIKGGGGKKGARVRYCADMMVSGHTYFAFLFSMSAYKQIAYNTELFDSRYNKHVRRAVFWTCVACICTEMLLVAAARFHYTVDMLASIVLVFLLYDSRLIEQTAANWSEGYDWQDAETFKKKFWFLKYFGGVLDTIADANFPPVHDKDSRIVPSQSTCFNHQRFAGTHLWDEPADLPEGEEKDTDLARAT